MRGPLLLGSTEASRSRVTAEITRDLIGLGARLERLQLALSTICPASTVVFPAPLMGTIAELGAFQERERAKPPASSPPP